MIKVIIDNTDELKVITERAEDYNVVVNNSEYFVNVFVPTNSPSLYPISPKGSLWLGENFKGNLSVSINTIAKLVPEGTKVEIKLMTTEEYETSNTEIA